ncbi:MAG: DUF3558 domain-containing protein [Actinomycetota bacterium]|nr:DUF3558 domain-containing protein [Actinomycetota bacterium]
MRSKIGALSVIVVVVAGCSTKAPGEAVPAPGGMPTATQTTKPVATSTPRQTTTASVEAPLGGVDPCQLLTSANRDTLGLKVQPKKTELSDRSSCRFSEDGFLLSVSVYPEFGLDSTRQRSSDAKDVPAVGRHRAVQSTFGSICGISMEVNPIGVVEVGGGVRDGDMQKACALAMSGAELVELKLP